MAPTTRKRLFAFAVFLFILALTGCGHKPHRPLRIAVNPWIGFTPILYAQHQGWLKDSDVKFIWAVGLEENVKLYHQGLVDGFSATQYEYFTLEHPESVRPFFLFDRSAGADVILANEPLATLRQRNKTDAYLEVTGLTKDLLYAFAKQYRIPAETIELHASDPETLARMPCPSTPTLLVSYEPYATAIEKHGYLRVASTRDLENIRVIDALWLNTDKIKTHTEALIKLKTALNRAIEALQADPRAYYDVVKGSLEGQSYEEFMQSLNGIAWINHNPSDMLQYLKQQHIATESLAP